MHFEFTNVKPIVAAVVLVVVAAIALARISNVSKPGPRRSGIFSDRNTTARFSSMAVPSMPRQNCLPRNPCEMVSDPFTESDCVVFPAISGNDN
jgi:hypothetical protein